MKCDVDLLAIAILHKESDLSRCLGVKDLIDFSWENRSQVFLGYESLTTHGDILNSQWAHSKGDADNSQLLLERDCSGLFAFLNKSLVAAGDQEDPEAHIASFQPILSFLPFTLMPFHLCTRK